MVTKSASRNEDKMDSKTNNDIQNTTQKTKYRGRQTPLNPGINSGATEDFAVRMNLPFFLM